MRSWARIISFIGFLALPGFAGAGVFDHNGDGDVDLDDYLGFHACLTAPDVPATPECAAAHDGDGDADVDMMDFLGFQLAFTGPFAVTEAQLAGNSLTAYPFFEYVRAFNENATVAVAVDPGRFPELFGLTCDLFVVEARTATEWMADQSLVDVRPPGPQTVTFDGTTIQGNTFLVAAADELDADAGSDLGVGYDVVLDCDRDDLLTDGDYIDGLGDEAGLYVVKDTVSLGPLPTTSITYSGGSWLGQKTWYPTGIAEMGKLPLVVISHGNGHDYTWYDYLQGHLASYGYIVMSHTNNTGPGIETASTTTLTNTDYVVGNQAVIGGGVLDGHIDSHRIVWIGHSRGGEGVCRAYDRLYDGSYSPGHYTLEDIVLVSSIAPNDYLGRLNSNPHDVNYHLLFGSADGDNGGWPDRESDASFHVYERAEGHRQVTYVHGADHNDFNCCGWDDFEGPPGTAIGRPEAQRVAKAAYLALIKHYVDGNVPAGDFLCRQYERLKPIGVSEDTIVDREYTEGPGGGVFVLDDFQSEPSLLVSSSGGAVTHDVQNPWEGRLDDTDGTFTWQASDPMNGMSRGRPDDINKGLVFDWSLGTDRFLEFEVVSAARDFSQYTYLSFRACQGTRHPETVAELEDLTFTITLRDAGGAIGSINFGAYGGGIEEPYQRTGSGSGAGWQNEFETIRIRLTDFLHNDSGLDLTDVEAMRFEFGAAHGSARGRVGFDDLYLSEDRPPGGLSLRLPDGAPDYIPPGQSTSILVQITAPVGDDYVPGSGMLHHRYGDGEFATTPLVSLGDDLYEAILPPPACDDAPEFFFSAEGSSSGVVYDPPAAPGETYAAAVGVLITFVEHDFEVDPGWTVSGNAGDGQWDRGVPVDCARGDPPSDYDGSGRCWLTDNSAESACNSDVDGGTTTVTSSTFDLSTLNDPMLTYARWYSNDFGSAPESDAFVCEVSDDGGASWVTLETVGPSGGEVHGGWFVKTFHVVDFVPLSAQFRIRWHASDLGDGSVVEAGLDAFVIRDFQCK